MANNLYEYILRITDQASATLQRVTGLTDSTTSRVNALSSSMSGLNRMMGAMGVTLGAVGIFNAGKSILTMAADLEQTAISYEVMTGSAEKAKKLMGEIRDMAARTPFETEDLNRATTTLMQFGVEQDKVLPIMQMLGDVSAGNKDRFSALSLAFAQVTSAGKLSGQDLLQFVNAGFNPLRIIADKTGQSMGQLRKAMEQGAISSDMVTEAFVSATSEGGQFYNMMDRQSQTSMGKWSTLVDKFKIKMTEFGTSLLPIANKAMEFGSNLMDIVQRSLPQIRAFFQPIKTIIDDVVNGSAEWQSYIDTLVGIFGGVWEMVSRIWFIVWDTVKQVVAFVQKSEILKDVFSAIGWFANVIFKVITAIVSHLKWMFDKIVMPILNGVDKAYKLVKEFFAGKPADITATQKKVVAITSAPAKIAPATMPGLSPGTDSKSTKELKSKTDKVTAGGTRNTSIQIHMGAMVDKISFTGSFAENRDELIRQVEEALMRTLYMAESAG